MTKSKKMNANYQEHDSKNRNKGGFFRFVLPLFWFLQMLNFASHFCFVIVEYLNVCFYFSLLVLGFWFVRNICRYFVHFGSFSGLLSQKLHEIPVWVKKLLQINLKIKGVEKRKNRL